MSLRGNTWFRMLALVAFALVALAACGGDDTEGDVSGGEGDSGGAGGGIALTAEDNSFDPAEISAPAGEEVTVSFTNEGSNPHTFSSEEADFDSDTVDGGGTAEVTFTMPDAETPFQCNIHGASMSGTLVPE